MMQAVKLSPVSPRCNSQGLSLRWEWGDSEKGTDLGAVQAVEMSRVIGAET